MDEAYILGNKHRRAIFYDIVAGETSINRIIKKQRMIRSIAERIIADFVKEGIVEQNKDIIMFTSEGKKLAERIGK